MCRAWKCVDLMYVDSVDGALHVHSRVVISSRSGIV